MGEGQATRDVLVAGAEQARLGRIYRNWETTLPLPPQREPQGTEMAPRSEVHPHEPHLIFLHEHPDKRRVLRRLQHSGIQLWESLFNDPPGNAVI